ncbi:MAG: hypothetical protein QX189_04595 [Methylococcales bacterium]
MSYFDQFTETSKPRSAMPKRDIAAFPFEEFATCSLDDMELLATTHNLHNSASWMIPQLMAKIGNLPLFRDDTGHYIARPFLETHIGSDPKMQGIWRIMARLPRGKLIKAQNKAPGNEHSALVPLILASIKKMQGVNYSEWTLESIPLLVDKNLSEAMVVPPNDIPDLTVSEILAIRKQGLITQSGKTAGDMVSPVSKWALTGIQDTKLGHLPKLAVTMITQIWVAHPSIRTSYMVLDPNDWDGMPKPLLESEVVAQPAKMFSKPVDPGAYPWL